MTKNLLPIELGAVSPEVLPSLPLNWRRSFPKCPAIYFAIANEKVLYIGRTVSLAQRWLNHHRQAELEDIEGVKIAWLELSDLELLPAIEKALIHYFKPPLNRTNIKVRKPKGKPGRKGGNPETYFRSKYQGELAKRVVGTKLPLEIDNYLRTIGSQSDWLRQAAIEKFEREKQREQAKL